MARKNLAGMRVAALAADGFEQVELTMPMKTLQRHGANVEIISLRPGKIKGMNALFPGKKLQVDRLVEMADPNEYDALLLPGGFVNPDLLRQSNAALEFVRAFDRAGKPIAVICHGPWVLASAGLTRGRRLTSWPGIKDDLLNAGAQWEDSAVVRDGNWVSSRGPQDIIQFRKAMVELFADFAPKEVRAVQTGSRLPMAGAWALGGLLLAGLGYLLRRSQVGSAVRERLTRATP